VGRSLWREDGSVVYNCYWSSPAQSFSGPSAVGLATIFYCPRFETSLFVASYDSQGYSGGIPSRLHTGLPIANKLRVPLWPGADRRQNTHFNVSSVVICVSVATIMRVHQKSLSSNGLFRVARGMCSAKRRPSDGHIPAFRRYVTIRRLIPHRLSFVSLTSCNCAKLWNYYQTQLPIGFRCFPYFTDWPQKGILEKRNSTRKAFTMTNVAVEALCLNFAKH
jgi:hypothetical protein